MIKKITFIITSGLLGVLIFPAPILAVTTISLSPSNIAVIQGQSFNIVIGVNPQAVKNYTAKIQIQFPADLLSVRSFAPEGSWMMLSQPGYDSVDNINGVLIKSAGYPGGFSSPLTFGTVSFLAKKSGTGIVNIEDASFILGATNNNVLSGPLAQTSVTIAVPILPTEEVLPPATETATHTLPTALFDISIQPDIRPFNGKLLTTILAGIGIFVLIIASYALYRKRNKKRL